MNLKGKNILFIGIGFYDYEEAIISELKNKGANVFYFSSFWNNRIIKFLQYRLKFNKIISNIKSIRINNLIKKNSLNIHIVFIIKGADFKQINIDILKKRCSNAKFVLYLWDSLKCTSNASLLLNNFENIYSFDKKDVEQNTKIKFRPLFYREKLNIKNDLSFIFDLLYIGTYYPERFSLIKIFLTKLKEHHLKYKICIHISIIKYFYLRFIKNEIKKEFSKLFILRPLSYNKYIEFLSQSKVVLDIAHMMQSGLTIRSIEALSMGCRLLTNNENIKEYNEIDKNSYYVYCMENPKVDIEFINSKKTQKYINNYFSLSAFIDELLD